MPKQQLKGTVAVVTGASRGAGRAAAIELGAAGATVYVTGRTARGRPATTYASYLRAAGVDRMPGTIEDTAEQTTNAGGQGIAVFCDHTQPDDVRGLFERVAEEHGRLDVLVANAWGGHESFSPAAFGAPFWQQPLEQWTAMIDHGVFNQLVAAQYAAPLLMRAPRGLIVATTFWDRGHYLRANILYDLAKAAINRLAFGFAEELRAHGVASIALSPGFMRTELVLAHLKTSEERFRDVPMLAHSESPHYFGRAVSALAADPKVMEKSGSVLRVADLAREYGFTDIDGRQPAAVTVV